MGKATIISDKGAGLYSIQPVPNTARAEAEIARLTARIADIDARLPDLQAAIDQAFLDLDYAKQVESAKILAYSQDPTEANQSSLQAATKAVRTAEATLSAGRAALRDATLEKTAGQKRIEYLQNRLPAIDPVDAWCADYSEALTGEVGTVEIPRRDPVAAPIIRPAGTDGTDALWSATRDGQRQPLVSGTAASVFWNLAMQPGADKWRPRYRLGEITSIDSALNIADVALDALTGPQGLDLNQTAVLADVPIVYLDCHAQAFEIGDRVLIEFIDQDWAQPQIVGFENQPRECSLRGFAVYADLKIWNLYKQGATWQKRELALDDARLAELNFGREANSDQAGNLVNIGTHRYSRYFKEFQGYYRSSYARLGERWETDLGTSINRLPILNSAGDAARETFSGLLYGPVITGQDMRINGRPVRRLTQIDPPLYSTLTIAPSVGTIGAIATAGATHYFIYRLFNGDITYWSVNPTTGDGTGLAQTIAVDFAGAGIDPATVEVLQASPSGKKIICRTDEGGDARMLLVEIDPAAGTSAVTVLGDYYQQKTATTVQTTEYIDDPTNTYPYLQMDVSQTGETHVKIQTYGFDADNELVPIVLESYSSVSFTYQETRDPAHAESSSGSSGYLRLSVGGVLLVDEIIETSLSAYAELDSDGYPVSGSASKSQTTATIAIHEIDTRIGFAAVTVRRYSSSAGSTGEVSRSLDEWRIFYPNSTSSSTNSETTIVMVDGLVVHTDTTADHLTVDTTIIDHVSDGFGWEVNTTEEYLIIDAGFIADGVTHRALQNGAGDVLYWHPPGQEDSFYPYSPTWRENRRYVFGLRDAATGTTLTMEDFGFTDVEAIAAIR